MNNYLIDNQSEEITMAEEQMVLRMSVILMYEMEK